MSADTGAPAASGARLLAVLHGMFAGWGFPVAALALLVTYKLLLLAVLFTPVDATALGRFAEEFKTWCFGYDPATGKMQPMYVAMMLTEPFALGGIIALVWWRQLAEALRAPRRIVPVAASSVAVVLAGAAAFGLLRTEEPQGELPFPAERLRTAYEPPQFKFVDQDGRATTLEEHKGRVVVLTGVYATCGYTCPMILSQSKRALAALAPEEREDVSVLAITLDPDRDDPAAMGRMAAGQKVSAPQFRLLTGDSAEVNAVLDRLGIARARNAQTGVIDHANLFLVVDREGKIAYRFTLGDRQETWLTNALRILVAEKPVG